uniref:hypothetical protein n=1 Tax=Thaumasiovibrio occultus TaxID=1891184 RepID=UPI000B358C21|nr:hypothetical protein [Thaumasiovibrio occultus]
MKYQSLLALAILGGVAQAQDLILTPTSLGELTLSSSTQVSQTGLTELFPDYQITHEIGQGDSPDFHLLKVSDGDEMLFYILSYIEDDVTHQSESYDIDLLVVTSDNIADGYGVRVGDRAEKLFQSLPGNIDVYANHYDNALGHEGLFYQFYIEPNDEGNDGANPLDVDIETILEHNPEISELSWPTPRWG